MSDKRKKYSPAEKAKIALDAIKSELTLAQITTKYGVHSTQVNTWKKQVLAYLPDAFSDKHKQEATTYETQLAELYEQIGRLKVENDFLKKKCEVFRG
jgi:transposase